MFDTACDDDCGLCGYRRIVNHIPGPEATETTAQLCTKCGKVMNPATGLNSTVPTLPVETPTEPTETQETAPNESTKPSEDPTEPTDGNSHAPSEEKEDESLITIAVIAIACMTILAVVLIVVLKKKG